jgi:LEA14-like dessication related protein
MRRALLVAAVVAGVAGGTGCATLARQAFMEPVVTLQNVRLNGLGLQGGNMDVILNVYNPNGYRLDATRVNYRLLIGDNVDVAQGTINERLTVQQNDSTRLTIPVAFTYRGIGEAGRQLLSTGAVTYRVMGDVAVGTPVGSFTVPYSTTGRFTTLGGTR